MEWKRIPKEHCKQPHSGKYSDWKEILAKEGYFQCVYCAIHESCFGGIRNFHVEHYRPKAKFKTLENDIKNLFYACPICNTFKGDDWPNEPLEDFSNPSYPDPSRVEYNGIFKVDTASGEIEGKYIAARYMLEKMNLNRPQLMTERRIFFDCLKIREFEELFKTLILALKQNRHKRARYFLAQIAENFIEISALNREFRTVRPYRQADIKRNSH
jgi:hypothetical protein